MVSVQMLNCYTLFTEWPEFLLSINCIIQICLKIVVLLDTKFYLAILSILSICQLALHNPSQYDFEDTFSAHLVSQSIF